MSSIMKKNENECARLTAMESIVYLALRGWPRRGLTGG